MTGGTWVNKAHEAIARGEDPLVIALDREGTIIRFFDPGSKVTGYRSNEVLGKNWFEVFIPDGDRKEIRQFLQDVWREEGVFHGNENPILTKDGRQILLHWYNYRLMNDHIDWYNTRGQIIAVGCVGYDITHLEEEEDYAS